MTKRLSSNWGGNLYGSSRDVAWCLAERDASGGVKTWLRFLIPAVDQLSASCSDVLRRIRSVDRSRGRDGDRGVPAPPLPAQRIPLRPSRATPRPVVLRVRPTRLPAARDLRHAPAALATSARLRRRRPTSRSTQASTQLRIDRPFISLRRASRTSGTRARGAGGLRVRPGCVQSASSHVDPSAG